MKAKQNFKNLPTLFEKKSQTENIYIFILKARYSKKAKQNFKNPPTLFERSMWEDFIQFFVAFSEYLNFN